MKLPDVRAIPRGASRVARWTGSIAYRSIVVPLLDRQETEHAIDLACRLAADRGARLVLVAPLMVERELPLNAHFDGELADLKARLWSAAAIATSYGVGVRQEIVRTRPGSLGEDVAPGLPPGVPPGGPRARTGSALPSDDCHRPDCRQRR
jgi:hypothetical protein